MKKRNFICLILGLFLSVLLVMPVYAEDPARSAGTTPDGAQVQPLDEQTLQQKQEDLMENLPFAFGLFPSFTVSNVDAFSFESVAVNGSGILGWDNFTSSGLGRTRVAGSGTYAGEFWAPIENIPTGAVVFGMQLEACDASATDQILVNLLACPSPADYCSYLETVGTGVSATPGCNYFNVVVDPPLQIFNIFATYNFDLFDNDLSANTKFKSVRLFWARVISPAPGSATFNDVPTSHAFFQHVEALAASGITTGCGDGTNFCPNQAVTRGQMAAFLARALGLHWPG